MVVIMQLITSGILCLIGVLLIAVHVIVLYRYSRRNSGDNQGAAGEPQLADESGLEGGRALRAGDFEKLPLFKYKEDQSPEKGTAVKNTECAVCLENFKAGDECRLLPICNHSFHAACIDLWLRKTPTCPVCRTWPVPSS